MMSHDDNDGSNESEESQYVRSKNRLLEIFSTYESELPNEYRVALAEWLRKIDNLENCEQRYGTSKWINHCQFSISVLINTINYILQYAHDIAENRVLRGQLLSEYETTCIRDLTEIYHNLCHLHKLPTTGISIPLQEHIKIDRYINNDQNEQASFKSLQLLDAQRVKKFSSRYIIRNGEILLRCGPVFQLCKKGEKLRYMFLTNYRIVVSEEELFYLTYSIELHSVQKLSVHNNFYFNLPTRSGIPKTFMSVKADEWVENISNAFSSLIVETKTIATRPEKSIKRNHLDILVTVKTVEGLRPSSKSRPDCPFFYVGIGNPERFGQDRIERFRSSMKKTRNPEFNETFTLKLVPSRELLVDIRFYSKVSGARNDFSYGVVNIPLIDILCEERMSEEINEWFDIFTVEGKEGRVHVLVETVDPVIPSWIPNYKAPLLPIMCQHDQFHIYEKSPLVYGGSSQDVLGIFSNNGTKSTLCDISKNEAIYSLEKGSFLRKEYIIRNQKGQIFAKCFHKMKTMRKRKIRMILSSNEHLYSMEGGCFDNKTADNEVLILNVNNRPVASVVFCETMEDHNGKMLMVETLDPLIDKPLIIIFALYILKTAI